MRRKYTVTFTNPILSKEDFEFIQQAVFGLSKNFVAFHKGALSPTEERTFLATLEHVRTLRATLKNVRYGFTHSLERKGTIATVKRSTAFLNEYREELKTRFKNLIREQRYSRRNTLLTSKRVTIAGVQHTIVLAGLVHTGSGLILKLAKQTKAYRVTQNKKPDSIVKHVGIEIEFCAPHDEDTLIEAFANAGLDKHVTLKSDGSVKPDVECECDSCSCCGEVHDCDCNSEDYGHEVCVIATQRHFSKVIRKVCEVLEEHDAYVNKTCGLHVHLDVRQRESDKVFSNLVHSYPVLSSLVPKQRKNNSFCVGPVHGVNRREYSGRYWAINPASVSQHGTIEVRLHTGTTNATKIIRWTRLLIAIADCNSIVEIVPNLSTLFKKIKLSSVLKNYLKARIEKFRGHVPSNLDERAA